ncbi:MAG: ChaN family lipoprotein [Bacteroidetes bacterium]|nr:ChaN family lipoprotein [Bacteroidota bacterium]
MKYLLLSLSLAFTLQLASAQTAYVIYNSNGKKVSYKKMMKSLKDADVVMFGEEHNNAIAHWLQYEVTEDLHDKRELILGAEMMEADNQNELDDYLSGAIDYKGLDTLARLWPNFKTDYKPLVDLAKENELEFVATNIPRRFARKVYLNGFETLDSLSAEEKSWIAPLPIPFDPELPTYQAILEMMGDHGTPELVKAQASKDATMAHFILANYEAGKLFIHYNGSYHSDHYEGIVWYLKRQEPDLEYATITTVSQADVKKLKEEHEGKADFIICVDEDVTRTY